MLPSGWNPALSSASSAHPQGDKEGEGSPLPSSCCLLAEIKDQILAEMGAGRSQRWIAGQDELEHALPA